MMISSQFRKENKMIKTILTTIFLASLSFSVRASIDMSKEYKELKKTTEQKIEVMDKKLEKVEDRISELSGDAKDEMEARYENFIEMKDDLKDRLADAGDTTADKWDAAKDRIEDYADDLESRIDKAIN